MKIIDIEDDVLAALEKQVRGFNDTPSAVIRRLLEQAARPETGMKKEPAIQTNNHTTNPFTPLVTSPAYLMANAGGRYLQILAFLRKLHGDQEFARLETIRFGGRVYFARDPQTIENSGSSTNPKPIPGSTVFALSTLSNAAKRKIITDVLRLFKYHPTVVGAVVGTLPDSGITKSRQFDYPLTT
jgi:negative modulator of initiation of replication